MTQKIKKAFESIDTIFADDIPVAKDTKSLEKIKKDFSSSGYDPYYVVSAALPERRKLFDSLWKVYRPYAENNFLTAVKKEFHNRTWEMYFGCVLIKNGIKIQDKGGKQQGPDFILTSGVYAECVVCTPGENVKPRVYSTRGKTVVNDVPTKEIQLRITNAIDNKRDQYRNWERNNWIDKKVPYILVINTYVGWSDGAIPNIVSVLQGLGDLTLHFQRDGIKTQLTSAGYSEEPFLKKPSGREVGKKIFEDKDYSFISAVVFSMTDVLNHPENLGDDLNILLNPNAQNPLETSELSFIKKFKMSRPVNLF